MSRGLRKSIQRPAFRILPLTLLLSAATQFYVQSADAQPAANLRQSASATDVEMYEMGLRSSLGFTSDLLDVRAIDSTGMKSPILDIPMTPSESIEVVRRNTIALAIPTISRTYDGDDTFAGGWLDNLGGGVLTIAFTAAPSAATLKNIQLLSPVGAIPRVVVVKYSLAQMHTAVDETRSVEDPDIQEVWVDQSANSVEISIPTDAAADAEQRITKELSGIGIQVTRAPRIQAMATASRTATTGGLISGQLIFGALACTMGFANATNSGGQTYSVTAGHCGANGTSFRRGSASGSIFGVAHNSQSHGLGNIRCDCAPVGPIAAPLNTRQYLDSNNNAVAFYASGTTAQGQYVCHDGYTTWNHYRFNACGTVVDPYNGEVIYNDYTIYSGVKVNIPIAAGDSGSALFGVSADNKTHILYGLLSGGSPNQGVWSNIAYLSDVNLEPVY